MFLLIAVCFQVYVWDDCFFFLFYLYEQLPQRKIIFFSAIIKHHHFHIVTAWHDCRSQCLTYLYLKVRYNMHTKFCMENLNGRDCLGYQGLVQAPLKCNIKEIYCKNKCWGVFLNTVIISVLQNSSNSLARNDETLETQEIGNFLVM